MICYNLETRRRVVNSQTTQVFLALELSDIYLVPNKPQVLNLNHSSDFRLFRQSLFIDFYWSDRLLFVPFRLIELVDYLYNILISFLFFDSWNY